MRRGLYLSTAVLVSMLGGAGLAMFGGSALAASACMDPMVPPMPDGKTAERDAVIAAAAAVKTYVAQSDEYQMCLNMEYEAYVNELKAQKPPGKADPKMNAEREAKITANQKSKETLGAAYGKTAAAYRQAHPPAPK